MDGIRWDHGLIDDEVCGLHAALPYNSLESSGPAARPLDFPTPKVCRGGRVEATALDHRTGKIHVVKNLLTRMDVEEPAEAFLIKKKLAKSMYGAVRLCVVMKRRRQHTSGTTSPQKRKDFPDAQWESTEGLVVVKISSWSKIRQLRGRHMEDPIKDVAGMQLVGDYHPNVLGYVCAMQDEEYLYSVMPYCSGGDLFGKVSEPSSDSSSAGSIESSHSERQQLSNIDHIDEAQARKWFRQLLAGLYHLQRKGICHRDITLDNLMVDDDGCLKIIDFGLALRVPYDNPLNPYQEGSVTDVSEGTVRRLMQAQGQGGTLMYLAPEIVAREEAFDGFAVDLWASAVVLFVLLVGLAPFEMAHESDKRYLSIARGNLRELLRKFGIQLSREACDLLQRMFRRDPRKRLTLAEVMNHPWVQGEPLPKSDALPPLHSVMPKKGHHLSPSGGGGGNGGGGGADAHPHRIRGVAH